MTSKIEQTITTDDRKALAAMDRLEKSFNRLTAAQRRTATESKRGADETSTGFEGLGRRLQGLERRFHVVRLGIQAMGQVAQAARQRMDDLASSAAKVAAAQGKLALTTARGSLDKIKGQVAALQGRDSLLTREQAGQAISATAGTSRATAGRKMELAQAAAQGWQANIDVGEFGGLLSALHEQGGSKKSIEQLQDEAAQFAAAGVSADEVRGARGSGEARSALKRRVKDHGAMGLKFSDLVTRTKTENPDMWVDQGLAAEQDRAAASQEREARMAKVGRKSMDIASTRSPLISGIQAVAGTLEDYIPGMSSVNDMAYSQLAKSGEADMRNAVGGKLGAEATLLAAKGSPEAQADGKRQLSVLEQINAGIQQLTKGPAYKSNTTSEGR